MKLVDLPVELLRNTQLFLDPRDIICLRKTCKDLASATYERVVWLSALIQACAKHGIYKPTFPLEDMSQQDLEEATLAPFRFLSLFGSAGRVGPKRTQILPVSRHPGNAREDMLARLWLVPGGRFLFTEDFHHTIHLWDLGLSSHTDIKMSPLASLHGKRAQIKQIRPTDDGLGVLFIAHTGLEQGPRQMQVYEIYPLSATPQFRLLGKLDTTNTDVPGSLLAFTDSLVIFVVHWTITFWNFKDNSSQTWSLNALFVKELVVIDEKLVLSDGRSLTVRKLPSLDLAHRHSLNFKEAVPILYTTNTNDYFTIIPPCSWPPNDSIPPYITFTDLTLDPRRRTLGLYTSVTSGDAKDGVLSPPMTLHREISLLPGGDNYYRPFYGPSRVCCDSVIQICAGVGDIVEGFVIGFAPPMPTTVHSMTTLVSTELFDCARYEARRGSIAFCPFSGRLCAVLKHAGSTQILIADYLT
ncbi:hypothetical protein Hypma_002097 [Hypsizygus marmoreus]|uniref:F-box domain-containing protein n=1 Tax=Hypsizygus marmoreus TaxID=39966 RepID=A0A369K5Q7_HYPMA|nr:hypothetical protein Hypma_002097 [Hypsizygus marmoreus]